MSTCAELPQMGCCDVETKPLGFYGVYVNEFPGSPQIVSPPNIADLSARLREKLSAVPFPTNPNTAHLYRWNYVDDLVFVSEVPFPASTVTIGTGTTSTGDVFQIIAGMEIAKDSSTPTYRISAGKSLAVTASRLAPGCVGEFFNLFFGADSESCSAPRLLASANVPFSSGYEYRLDTAKREFEILCPAFSQLGRAIRTANWVASGAFIFGSLPPCCDLSPLPP